MKTLHFDLVAPERLLFSGEVESVVVPSVEGEFMVFVDHAPVMAALRPGVLTITGDGGNTTKLFVRGGFAEVSGSALTILADDAMPLEQLDAASVDRQLKHLEEQLEIAQDDEAQRSATEKLAQMRDLRSALKL